MYNMHMERSQFHSIVRISWKGELEMKKFRYILALVLALTILMASPLSALAATHSVATSEELAEAFYNDTEKEVIINLEKDIVVEHYLEAGKDQSYTINGEGNTLANVGIGGEGEVVINADIVNEEVTYETSEGTESYTPDALSVSGGAQVTVNGDITAEDAAGVWVDDTVWEPVLDAEGNQVLDEDGYPKGEEKNLGASVTVNGDVTGDAGVVAYGTSEVTVNGDVSGQNVKDSEYAGEGIVANDKATVTVDGNVSGGDGYLTEEEMKEPEAYSDGRTAIAARDESTVTVTGDVTGGDAMGTCGWAADAIVAGDKATVAVGGDVTGGNVIANPDVEAEKFTDPDSGETYVNASAAGDAIVASYGATVTVEGNATGGSTNGESGEGGNAIVAESGDLEYDDAGKPKEPEAGSVTVEGTVSGGEGGENGADGAAIYYDSAMMYEEISTDLEEVLETPVEDLTDEDYMVMSYALYCVQENGDLTEEEMEAYGEAFEEELKALEAKLEAGEITQKQYDEQAAALEIAFAKEMLKEEASSLNLLELEPVGYAEITVGTIAEDSIRVNSTFGVADAQEYAKENVTEVYSNGNPATGESYSVVLFGLVAMTAMLGFAVVLNKRKETV